MKERNSAVDVARGALMLYVVFIIHGVFWLELMPVYLSSWLLFEMPAIFVVSGYSYYLFVNSPKQRAKPGGVKWYSQFMAVKLTRILIPYFAYSVVCAVLCFGLLPMNFRDILLAWLNPIKHGKNATYLYLNWHLWFIPIFLIVSALQPLVAGVRLPLRLPVWSWVLLGCAIVELPVLWPFPGSSAAQYLITYSLWAWFGFQLAASQQRYSIRDWLLVLLVSGGGLMGMWMGSVPGFSWEMQANKFPPNGVFFLFSCAWVAILLLATLKGGDKLVGYLAKARWFRPFIASGYSVYLAQGLGYTAAVVLGQAFQLPIVVVWVLALLITVLLGSLAGPLERIRFRG